MLVCLLSIALATDFATSSSIPPSIKVSYVDFSGSLFASSKAFNLASNSLFFFSASFLSLLSLFKPLCRDSFSSSTLFSTSVFPIVSTSVSTCVLSLVSTSVSLSSTSGKIIVSLSGLIISNSFDYKK